MPLNTCSFETVVYSVVFRTLAADSGWNDESFQEVFLNRLGDQVKDKLETRDNTDTTDSQIFLATQLDNHLRECQRAYLLTFFSVPLPDKPISRFNSLSYSQPGSNHPCRGTQL